MLTLTQVSENNKVAKDILKELNLYFEVYNEEKENDKLFLKNAFFFKKVGFYFFKITEHLINSKECAAEMHVRMHMSFLKKDICRYFKQHYLTSANYSKIISPKIEIKMYRDNILWATITTYKIKDVPHPTR